MGRKENVTSKLSDPTRREMILYLGRQWKRLDPESWRDNAEIAMYWYAVHYHGGQWSNLYAASCESYYNPGPFSTLESEEGTPVMDMYSDLENRFGKAGEEVSDSDYEDEMSRKEFFHRPPEKGE